MMKGSISGSAATFPAPLEGSDVDELASEEVESAGLEVVVESWSTSCGSAEVGADDDEPGFAPVNFLLTAADVLDTADLIEALDSPVAFVRSRVAAETFRVILDSWEVAPVYREAAPETRDAAAET
jgi:hypothetical protein